MSLTERYDSDEEKQNAKAHNLPSGWKYRCKGFIGGEMRELKSAVWISPEGVKVKSVQELAEKLGRDYDEMLRATGSRRGRPPKSEVVFNVEDEVAAKEAGLPDGWRMKRVKKALWWYWDPSGKRYKSKSEVFAELGYLPLAMRPSAPRAPPGPPPPRSEVGASPGPAPECKAQRPVGERENGWEERLGLLPRCKDNLRLPLPPGWNVAAKMQSGWARPCFIAPDDKVVWDAKEVTKYQEKLEQGVSPKENKKRKANGDHEVGTPIDAEKQKEERDVPKLSKKAKRTDGEEADSTLQRKRQMKCWSSDALKSPQKPQVTAEDTGDKRSLLSLMQGSSRAPSQSASSSSSSSSSSASPKDETAVPDGNAVNKTEEEGHPSAKDEEAESSGSSSSDSSPADQHEQERVQSSPGAEPRASANSSGNWIKLWSDEFGIPYFWNELTDESCWEDPGCS
jgi:hypothetical protein